MIKITPFCKLNLCWENKKCLMGMTYLVFPEYRDSCSKHVPLRTLMLCLQTYFKGYWVLWGMRLLNQGHFPYPLNVDLISLPLSCHLTVVWTAARAMTLPWQDMSLSWVDMCQVWPMNLLRQNVNLWPLTLSVAIIFYYSLCYFGRFIP